LKTLVRRAEAKPSHTPPSSFSLPNTQIPCLTPSGLRADRKVKPQFPVVGVHKKEEQVGEKTFKKGILGAICRQCAHVWVHKCVGSLCLAEPRTNLLKWSRTVSKHWASNLDEDSLQLGGVEYLIFCTDCSSTVTQCGRVSVIQREKERIKPNWGNVGEQTRGKRSPFSQGNPGRGTLIKTCGGVKVGHPNQGALFEIIQGKKTIANWLVSDCRRKA